MSLDEAKDTFEPLTKFMEAQPGMQVADVGAGSGVFTVIMGTQLDDCIIYIQDIDASVLQKRNVDKVIRYYSEQTGQDVTNDFRVIYGSPTKTNLPDASLDVVYMNAVVHVLDYPDEILYDLQKKLTPTGKIFIRDGFKNHDGEGEFCSSSKCGKPLLSISELHEIMERNGYSLYKESSNMDGYPVFGFRLKVK
jgi:ubiquinone/menaquinone biosynthesis C-methylase UbiE